MRIISLWFAISCAFLFTLNSLAENTIDDFYFRYDFSKGTKVYEHNGCAKEPCTESAAYYGVYGTNGYATAVHPKGWGNIADGDALLNADWSFAMSVKSTDVEKGVLMSIGTNSDVDDKQVLFCSSAEAGKLSVAICQRYAKGSINIPTSITLSDLGDTINSFHSIVAVHTISDNIIKLYWDGRLVGTWNSNANQGGKVFADGFQFCSSHGGNPGGYSNLSDDYSVSFQDVRFFTRALSAEEAELYAQTYPVASVHLNDFYFH